jgi:hypothetical protein
MTVSLATDFTSVPHVFRRLLDRKGHLQTLVFFLLGKTVPTPLLKAEGLKPQLAKKKKDEGNFARLLELQFRSFSNFFLETIGFWEERWSWSREK